MSKLVYKDTVTFYKVTSNGYRSSKVVDEFSDVKAIFLQNTGLQQGGFREENTSDAVVYPDPTNTFIKDNANRLEGMYVQAILFTGSSTDSWFKVTEVRVNRDHLLKNRIDNIECKLKRTTPIAGVS